MNDPTAPLYVFAQLSNPLKGANRHLDDPVDEFETYLLRWMLSDKGIIVTISGPTNYLLGRDITLRTYPDRLPVNLPPRLRRGL